MKKKRQYKAKTLSSQRTPGALYPYDNLDRNINEENREVEWKKLDNALKDERITNLAISAPYDTGKTSFLLTYFTDREKKRLESKKVHKTDSNKRARKNIKEGKVDFRFITLSNCFDSNQNNKKIEEALEREIIDQLLFNVNPWNYPDSKILRLKEYKTKWLIVFLILVNLFLLSVFGSIKGYEAVSSLFNPFKIGVIIFGNLLLFLFMYLFIHSISKLIWTLSTKLGPAQLQIKVNENHKDDDINLFILYHDELSYFFNKKPIFGRKIKFVIFEDLDRYDDPLIFQRLRALNINLNRGKNKIVFIYTLKDSIFAKKIQKDIEEINIQDGNQVAARRAKFFDYILPLIPINSFHNSKEYFKGEIKKYCFLKNSDIDDTFLYRIGMYIYDPREIVNLVSELDIYTCKLNNPSISTKKLFAMIIYKNLFPNDFEGICAKKSKVAYLIDHKDEMANSTLRNMKIGSIFKYITRHDEKLNFIKNKNRRLYKAISYVNDREILRFLVINNLIDLTFYDYISPTPYKLGSTDTYFVQNVINQRSPLHNIQVNNGEKIVQALMLANADFKYAYSDGVLTALVKSKASYEKIRSLLMEIKVNEDYEFIIKWINDSMQNNNSSLFITEISLLREVWESFFDDINKINNDKFVEFILDILLFESENSNERRVFNWYKARQILLKNPLQSKISKLIKRKKYKGRFIDFVNKMPSTISLEKVEDLAGNDEELKKVLIENKWYKNYGKYKLL